MYEKGCYNCGYYSFVIATRMWCIIFYFIQIKSHSFSFASSVCIYMQDTLTIWKSIHQRHVHVQFDTVLHNSTHSQHNSEPSAHV